MWLTSGRSFATAADPVADRSSPIYWKTSLAGSCIPKNEDPNGNLRQQMRVQDHLLGSLPQNPKPKATQIGGCPLLTVPY